MEGTGLEGNEGGVGRATWWAGWDGLVEAEAFIYILTWEGSQREGKVVQAQLEGDRWQGGTWVGLDLCWHGQDPVLPQMWAAPCFSGGGSSHPHQTSGLFPEFPGLWEMPGPSP